MTRIERGDTNSASSRAYALTRHQLLVRKDAGHEPVADASVLPSRSKEGTLDS